MAEFPPTQDLINHRCAPTIIKGRATSIARRGSSDANRDFDCGGGESKIRICKSFCEDGLGGVMTIVGRADCFSESGMETWAASENVRR